MKINTKQMTVALLLTTACAAASILAQLSSGAGGDQTYQSSFRPTDLESNANTPRGLTLSESGSVRAVAELGRSD